MAAALWAAQGDAQLQKGQHPHVPPRCVALRSLRPPAVHTQYLVPPGRYSFGLMLRALEAGSGGSSRAAVAQTASSAWRVLL
jgi:hypothetical protein